jgi:hypothetical protein
MNINLEDVQSALFDAYDVRDALGGDVKDEDLGAETLGEKLYNVILFLEELEAALTEGETK